MKIMKDLHWWRKYWLEFLLLKLFPKTIKSIVQEELTQAVHPDFGWVWQEMEEKREKGKTPLR